MTQNLKPHEQRVVEEKAELDARLIKLRQFLMSDVYETLDSQDRWLLRMQLDAMDQYSRTLAYRIQRFKELAERSQVDTESDKPLSGACDLSGDGTCEACQ